jgi:ApbE superfamily uncharacterized protein (UPF0280 family)
MSCKAVSSQVEADAVLLITVDLIMTLPTFPLATFFLNRRDHAIFVCRMLCRGLKPVNIGSAGQCVFYQNLISCCSNIDKRLR